MEATACITDLAMAAFTCPRLGAAFLGLIVLPHTATCPTAIAMRSVREEKMNKKAKPELLSRYRGQEMFNSRSEKEELAKLSKSSAEDCGEKKM